MFRLRTVLAVFFSILGMSVSSQAGPHKLMGGHVPEAVSHQRSTDRLNSGMRMALTLGLPLRNTNQLAQRLADIYDPSSAGYRRFLTPEEFTANFGPSAEQYRAVEAFARSNHLTVVRTHSNRVLMDVRATAADIEKAFGITLSNYQRAEGGEFFAPDVEPSVPDGLALLDVSGLSNFRLPHPMIRAQAVPHAGSATTGGYMGNDFRAAYAPGVALTGAGQSLGLLEFDGYYPADITTYETKAGLSNIPLQNVLLDGYAGTPTSAGNAEVSLDIEVAIAMAPGMSNIVVYEAGSNGSPNDLLNRMATDNSCKQLSCSWTWSGGPSATTDQIFQQMALQGQSFFCASGDSDAYASGTLDSASQPNTPADSVYITSVGATTLSTAGAGGPRLSETVWNWGGGEGSGGGVSSYYAMPAWQKGISMAANGGSTNMRNIPDVAMAGDNIYIVYGNGTAGNVGGTSCAAPLWAAMTALVNQQATANGQTPVGFLNPALYAIAKSSNYSSAFYDVTTGNNTNASNPTGYFAASGYDLCTGLGTPNAAGLISALVAAPDTLRISPTNGFSASGVPGGPYNITSGTFVLTNSGTNVLKVCMGSTASWLALSATNGIVSGGSSILLTAALTSDSTNLPAGASTATIWFTNSGTGTVQSRTFVVNVNLQLVQNGGFELGNLSGWTQSGNTAYSAATTSTSYLHGGLYGGEFGPSGTVGGISQNIPTVTGQSYVVSVWLMNGKPGGAPNQFSLTWNGSALFSQTNLGVLAWTNLQYIVKATGTSTPLQLNFRNDPSYFGVDDISVMPFNAPSLRSLARVNNTMQISLNTTPGLIYQLQYVTDLAQTNWVNMGQPFTATDAVTAFADSGATDLQRFYRVIVHP